MQQFCQYGSVRGATGNRRPYRDNSYTPQRSTAALARNTAGVQAPQAPIAEMTASTLCCFSSAGNLAISSR